jgi:ethanolamine utilization microcompartment shell protein EutS
VRPAVVSTDGQVDQEQVPGGQIVVHHEISRMHTLHTLGLRIGYLSTAGAGLAHLLSEATAREAVADCAVEIAQASADLADRVSVTAILHLAEEGGLAEGGHLVVLSAR